MIKPFSTNVPLLYPLKTGGFLMFSRDIEVEHWLKIGQKAEGIKNSTAEGLIKKNLKIPQEQNIGKSIHWLSLTIA